MVSWLLWCVPPALALVALYTLGGRPWLRQHGRLIQEAAVSEGVGAAGAGALERSSQCSGAPKIRIIGDLHAGSPWLHDNAERLFELLELMLNNTHPDHRDFTHLVINGDLTDLQLVPLAATPPQPIDVLSGKVRTKGGGIDFQRLTSLLEAVNDRPTNCSLTGSRGTQVVVMKGDTDEGIRGLFPEASGNPPTLVPGDGRTEGRVVVGLETLKLGPVWIEHGQRLDFFAYDPLDRIPFSRYLQRVSASHETPASVWNIAHEVVGNYLRKRRLAVSWTFRDLRKPARMRELLTELLRFANFGDWVEEETVVKDGYWNYIFTDDGRNPRPLPSRSDVSIKEVLDEYANLAAEWEGREGSKLASGALYATAFNEYDWYLHELVRKYEIDAMRENDEGILMDAPSLVVLGHTMRAGITNLNSRAIVHTGAWVDHAAHRSFVDIYLTAQSDGGSVSSPLWAVDKAELIFYEDPETVPAERWRPKQAAIPTFFRRLWRNLPFPLVILIVAFLTVLFTTVIATVILIAYQRSTAPSPPDTVVHRPLSSIGEETVSIQSPDRSPRDMPQQAVPRIQGLAARMRSGASIEMSPRSPGDGRRWSRRSSKASLSQEEQFNYASAQDMLRRHRQRRASDKHSLNILKKAYEEDQQHLSPTASPKLGLPPVEEERASSRVSYAPVPHDR
ncbi:unnamed protein product [Vitrella brassicaformis CCMP3155]|uniref:Uncharacterized protein n=2 Tax=Vitrella brassicaformis TaxID=1169539 RepID=A0A0G4GA33_VITBC|nr:unnamed protein product [Vitrella brassicaformis CCMP3155]|mmetsp:Transcript_1032/g.2688  ORF Transcript_1032/g.2688 Transcript_1032/m.2688 type:complete len:677 (+) Transcript_1032:90-2120(+)|eukprot:CEM25717.1 unnamed protein product [Vitrella brassicaformis CCMP3155]